MEPSAAWSALRLIWRNDCAALGARCLRAERHTTMPLHRCTPPAAPARHGAVARGRLVYLVGPSGAGKDTVLRALAAMHPLRLRVARRTIDRGLEDAAEDFESVTSATFGALHAQHAFALQWRAHGRRYGVRRAELAARARGIDVVVNGSRAYLPRVRAQHPELVVVLLSAPTALLRQRLQCRGRDSPAQIAERLARNAARANVVRGVLRIVNDSTPAAAACALLRTLQGRESRARFRARGAAAPRPAARGVRRCRGLRRTAVAAAPRSAPGSLRRLAPRAAARRRRAAPRPCRPPPS